MKKTFFAAIATTFMLSACGPSTNLSGTISGVESDTILIYRSDAIKGSWLGIDTVALKDGGHFEINIPDSILTNVCIAAKNNYGEKKAVILNDQFLFFPGEKMIIQGVPPYGLSASGTNLYDLLNSDKNLKEKNAAMQKVIQEMDVVSDDETKADSLDAIYDQKQKELDEARFQFIKSHPNSYAAGLLASYLEGAMGLEAITLLSEEIRNGAIKPLLDECEEYCKEAIEIEKHKQLLRPGSIAPDFHLKDLNNNTKSLADFRGKYVVLDFWGTWCGWCLAGIPKMKEYYNKYSDNIEFVGICCNDHENRWRKCVEKNKMNWINLFNEESSNTPIIYGVDGYPTKIIIDKEGNIEKVVEGESQEFYDYLDHIFE